MYIIIFSPLKIVTSIISLIIGIDLFKLAETYLFLYLTIAKFSYICIKSRLLLFILAFKL